MHTSRKQQIADYERKEFLGYPHQIRSFSLSAYVSPPTLPSFSLCSCGYRTLRMPRRQKRNRKARVRAGPYLRRVYPHLRTDCGNVHTRARIRASTGMKTATPVSAFRSSMQRLLLYVPSMITSDDKLKRDLTLHLVFCKLQVSEINLIDLTLETLLLIKTRA